MAKLKVANDGKAITAPTFPKQAVISHDNRLHFAFREKGKTYRAENLNRHIGLCLQIDGSLIATDNKCDNALLLDDGRFFLIELKGIDYEHAYNQLLATKNWLEKTAPYSNYDFDFLPRIVAKGYPKAKTELQKIKRKAITDFGKNKFKPFESGRPESV